MKKILFAISLLTAIFFSGIMSATVHAETTFDKSNVSKGVLAIKTDAPVSQKLIKLKVELVSDPKSYYAYIVKTNNTFYVPLQMGNGKYKVTMLENVSGTKYKAVGTDTFDVAVKTPNDMFLYASPTVNFSGDMAAIKGFKAIVGTGDAGKKLANVYADVTKNYTYDHDKAKKVGGTGDYVPVIDEIFKSKKGICFDYSALTAGVLRTESIPTKLVMGYAPDIDVLHAWNEVLINGKWVIVDLTTDAAYVQAKQSIKMEKEAKKYKVVKIY